MSGTASVALVTVAGASGPPGASLEGVSPSLSYYAGTYNSVSQLTGLTALTGAPTGAGAYTVLASFAGSADYTPATGLANFTITPATPTVNAMEAGGTYSGTAFVASATVAGVSGLPGASLEGVAPSLSYYAGTHTSVGQLAGLSAMSGAPVGAGSYTVLADFAGSADYTPADLLVDFVVSPATPTVAVVDAGGTYDGLAFGADATVAGVGGGSGPSLEGVSLTVSYYAGTTAVGTPMAGAPTAAGTYTVLASFPGSTDYAAATALASFRIDQATPTVAWNPPAAITYGTGLSARQLDATASVPGLFAYSPAAGAVLGAGVQTLSVTFTPNDDADDSPVTMTTGITVARATPTVSVSDGGGTYNGAPFAATADVVGLGNQPGPSLEGVSPTLSYYAGTSATGTPMAGAPSAVGTYTVVAVFPGSSDYASAWSAPVTFEITAPSEVTASSTTVALTSSAGSTVYGEPVTLTAAVTSTNPGAGTPTGTVTFFDGTSQLGAVTLDGSGRATLTVSSLALGGHSITADYGGDAGFLGGQSGAVSQSVTPDGTAVVLVPHAVLKKKKVVSLTLTAQVQPLAPGGGVPTGVVSFRIKKKTLGTVALVGGQAALPVKSRSVLNKPITVIYGGGGDFQSSTLASTTLTSRSFARPAHSLARKSAHPTAPPRAISRKLRKI